MRPWLRIGIERFIERATGRILVSSHELKKLRHDRTLLNDNTRLYKNWEINQLRRVFTLLKPTIVFDIGAHHGEYAEMLLTDLEYKGSIISVEANPYAFSVLERKASDNPMWHVLNQAIGDSNGRTSFNIMASTQFSSLNKPVDIPTAEFNMANRIEETVTVNICTLESLRTKCEGLGDCSRGFLKLDTQGSDLYILQASQNTAQEFLGIQCELSIIKIYQGSPDFLELIPFLYELGFSLNAFIPNNPGHFPILIETDAILLNNRLLCQYYGVDTFDVTQINSMGM